MKRNVTLRAPASRRIRCNGLELCVHEWPAAGNPRGVLVALHGFQDGGRSFDRVAPPLAGSGLHVFAPDLRGFGESEWIPPGGYYHFPDYVFDVADLIDALSPDAPIVLVGHSMGGTIASMYAGVFPKRVALLALLEGVGPPAMPETISPDRFETWIAGVRTTRARGDKTMSIDEAVRRLAQNHPKVPEDVLRVRAEQLTREVEAGRRVWTFDPLHRTTSPVSFSIARWKAHAARIDCPTLIVGGGPSGFHPEDEADRVATIPTTRVVDMADAGHMMHWTRPIELARIIHEFVGKNS